MSLSRLSLAHDANAGFDALHASVLHSSSRSICRHRRQQSTVKHYTCQAAVVQSSFDMLISMVNTESEPVFQIQAGLCAICLSIQQTGVTINVEHATHA